MKLFKSNSNKQVDISSPKEMIHVTHVDLDLNWNAGGESSFQIEEKLGEGSFGSVYRAVHKSSNKSLAIKEFDIFEAEDVEPITKEIQVLKKCSSNPYVVSYYGSIKMADKLWILMDYCALGSFNDIMQSLGKTIKEKEIALIMQQSLQGLNYLHSKKIIHRDVKGANILLSETGTVKIADFGVSQQISTTFAKGTITGSPYWMAPEMLNQDEYSLKIDVWSLGITAIELADGEPPLSEVKPMRAMFHIGRKPPPTLKEPKKWSDEFNSFIEKCLTKNVDDRWSPPQLLDHPFIKNAKPDALKELTQIALKFKNKKRKSTGGGNSPKLPTPTPTPIPIQPQPTSSLINRSSTSNTVIYKPNVFGASLDTGSVVVNGSLDSGSVIYNNSNGATNNYDSVNKSTTTANVTSTTKPISILKNKFGTIKRNISRHTIQIDIKTLEAMNKTPLKKLDEKNQRIVLYSTLSLILLLSIFFKFFK